MRILLITLALTLTALAGCLGGDDAGENDNHNDDHNGDDGPGHNETVEPEVTFSANVTSGEAPLTVLFSIDAVGFDEDFAAWELDANGDDTADATGQDFPAEFEFIYEDAGNFTATLTVTDGFVTRTQSVNLTFTAPEVPELEPIVLSGTITGLWVPEVGYLADPEVHTFELVAQPAKMTLVLEWDMQAIDLDFRVLTPDGSTAGSAAEFNDPALGNGENTETIEITGSDLAQLGEWTVEVLAASAFMSEYTVTITFE